MKEEKLIKSLLPKISEYFDKHVSLKKEDLSEFLDFIDLNIWNSENEKEILWTALSQDTSDERELQRVLLIKNLTNFIHSHDKDLFQPEKALETSVKQYFTSVQPYYSNDIHIDNNDAMYEVYKTLALFQYANSKSVSLKEIDTILKANAFLKIDKENLLSSLSSLLKAQVEDNISIDNYLTIMEQFGKMFKYKQNEITGAYVFSDADLEEPEHKNYGFTIDYVNVIFRLMDSVIILNRKVVDNEKGELTLEMNKRYFFIIINCVSLFLNEIEKIFYEQKQKFDFFNDRNREKINYLREEIENMESNKLNQSELSSRDNNAIIVEEINNLKNININLNNELKKISKELSKKEEELIISNNNLIFSIEEKKELETKYNLLKADYDKLNNTYINLLNQFNRKILNKNSNESTEMHNNSDQLSKEINDKLNLNDEQKNLVNKYHEELISYVIEKEKYCAGIEEKNEQYKKNFEEFENIKKNYEKELNELKILSSTQIQKINTLQSANELLLKDLEMSKSNKGKLLSSILSDLDEDNNKGFQMIKNVQIYVPGQKLKVPIHSIKEPEKRKNFDFLGMKMTEEIIQNLDDNYYNTNSNLIFTEKINYIDEKKASIQCILVITESFMYMFNKSTLDKCFSIPLVYLQTINASTNNNLISLTFHTGEIIIFEIFRVLEFINFFQTINANEKANNYSININNYNNLFLASKKKNYTTCPYYGKARLSGYLKKRVDGVVTVNYYERFVVLCDIGMIILDDPLGKPLEIINLLFAETHQYEDKNGIPCFEIAIGKTVHVFKSTSANLRQNWINEIERWIVETYTEQNQIKK